MSSDRIKPRAMLINPPASRGVKIVREGRCMQREGAWTAIWPPISLAYCARVLEDEGFEVLLPDCIVEDISLAGLESMVREFRPCAVVFNTATPSIESDLETAAMVKRTDPGIATAAFGIHVTALPGETLDMAPELDAVIRGEPEYTVREFCLSASSGQPIDPIRGLSFRSESGHRHNPDRPRIENLDHLGFPAWHLIKQEKYAMPFSGERFFLVATNRGCPYACTFCAARVYYGSRLTRRSPRHVVHELQWAVKTHGVRDFLFWSESFTVDLDHAKAVCREILARELDVSYVINSRVDTVDEELMGLLKRSGCWMVGYGIESFDPEVLERCRKGVTPEQIEAAIAMTRAAGLEVTAHCILGLPGDTPARMGETLKRTAALGVDYAQFYCAVPFPGSAFYEEAKTRGWIADPRWSRFEQNYSVLDYPELKAKQVMAFRSKAYKKFYIRPRKIIDTLKKLTSWTRFKRFLRMVKDFITWF